MAQTDTTHDWSDRAQAVSELINYSNCLMNERISTDFHNAGIERPNVVSIPSHLFAVIV